MINIHDATIRRHGESTALALSYLHDAYQCEGELIEIVDHFGSRESDALLTQRVIDMAAALGLTGFAKESQNTLRYTSPLIPLLECDDGTTYELVKRER